MESIIEAAVKYRSDGLSVVPVTAGKNPIGEWHQYQRSVMTEEELQREFTRNGVRGVAIVCGAASGNFEAIDLDTKYDPSRTLTYEYISALREADFSLYDRLISATTRSSGYHLYYRAGAVGRNTVLARRLATPEERILYPKVKTKVLIETRSNGGIIVVPPTKGYRLLQRDFSTIPVLTAPEHQLLFNIARAFNQVVLPPTAVHLRSNSPHCSDENSPFYHYDRISDESTIRLLLEAHDWLYVETVLPRSYYRRPGRTEQRTSGHFHHDLKLFKSFSPNTDFEPEKPYPPHAVFAILECRSNFRQAARRLIQLGFGKPYKRA